jgi:XrtN system VIT domain protein
METTRITISRDTVEDLEAVIFGPKPVYRDGIFITGLVLTALSAILFFFPELSAWQLRGDSFIGFFFLNYALTVSYFVVLLVSGLLKFKWTLTRNYTENIFLFLILSLISAFSLNREIPIFERSTEWLAVFLVAQCVGLLALCFRRLLPDFVTYTLYFLLGSGLVLYLYFAIYLLPIYPMGLIGAIFLGFSLHAFVPLFFLLFLGVHFIKAARQDRKVMIAGLTGLAVPLVVLGVFLAGWEHARTEMNFAINRNLTEGEQLPNWVVISQQLSRSPLAAKLLKTDLVYSTPREKGFSAWNLPSRNFSETRKHDPFVMIAAMLLGKPDLTETERIKILEAMYDSRHQAQERLWSGNDLQTASVVSNVRLFPEFRMAYTEKIISIHNNYPHNWGSQEAIYTFHLPEGGVVSSLSLWINGHEEKAILTTKAQADSAYKTIVGIENRDPSVVHWQEGNTVSVRVFPCTPGENRRFKIGVTAPLQKNGNKLTYRNIYFDGPDAGNATETIKLDFTTKPENGELPFSFSQQNSTVFNTDRSYAPYWEISCHAPQLSTAGFSFDGQQYRVEDYLKTTEYFQPEAIYLDLNSAWSKAEFLELWDAIKTRKVYVCAAKRVQLTDENLLEVFEAQQKLNFSLLPLHQIQYQEKALVISKSNALSPNVKDLQGSTFAARLTGNLQQQQPIRLYNLGEELSPYLKTLKEMRVFTYDQGSLKT